jgi:hypothetical protein
MPYVTIQFKFRETRWHQWHKQWPTARGLNHSCSCAVVARGYSRNALQVIPIRCPFLEWM